MELSKKEKQKAKALINTAVEKEFEVGLKSFDSIIQKWKSDETNSRDAYHEMFKRVQKFDKHIAYRYDKVSNDSLMFLVAELLLENLVSEIDLEVFREEVKDAIMFIASRYKAK